MTALLSCLIYSESSNSKTPINLCTVAADSNRIAVAGGSITEILYYLEKPDNIVATDITSNYPVEAQQFPSVGYVRNLSAEGLLSLKPTLILAEHDAGPPEVLAQLSALDIDIRLIPEHYSANGIIQKVNCIAEIIGMKSSKIETATAPLKKFIHHLNTHDKTRRIRAGVLLSTSGGLMVAGIETSGNGILSMTGLSNAFENIEGWKPITKESMLNINPELLLTTERTLSTEGGMEGLLNNTAIKLTQAAQKNHIYSFDGMALLGFGPRTLESASKLLTLSEKINQKTFD